MSAGGLRSWAALALQLSALLTISLSLLGFTWLDPRSKPRILLLVDRSLSVPRSDADKAMADVAGAAKAAGASQPQLIEFADRPELRAAQADAAAAPLDVSATNIEAALQAALALHAQSPLASMVVISDGLENVGDAAHALRAVREARLPVHWIAVDRPPPPTRVAEVLAPQRILTGQRIQITVQLAGQLDKALRVTLATRSASGATQTASNEADGAGRATIEFDADHAGATRVDVTLQDAASGQSLDAWPDAAVIDVLPRAAVLYAQGSSGFLARSLRQGGWTLDVVPVARLDARADALDGYQAVVLDDVAIADATPRFWNALVAAVKQRGVGLLVLGGERSFARGGYRESTLESVLPVISEPPALDQPAAVVFAVDKSGSMGQGSGGVDRFRLAQSAVLATARRLGERDSMGLVVFDVAPRVLVPLGPATAGIAALERDWLAGPNGGTKLAPALEAAVGELERSGNARRILVLVTDGFADDAPLAELRARLDRSRIETIALAVGPDANTGALERLFGSETSLVLRVNESADLPVVMRSAMERRRAQTERGAIGVKQRHALPFPPGAWTDWPDIAAYLVTRARPQASVAVQSQRGDPLIAFGQFGTGRVVAVTSGLGPWTPQWLVWREWPRLAGGLTDWSAGTGQRGAAALTVSDLPGGLQIDAEFNTAAGQPSAPAMSLIVDTPKAQGQVVAMEHVAPGRLRATLADAGAGLYTFQATDSGSRQRQLHLRRPAGEHLSWGTNPALDGWRSAGLISPWDPGLLAQRDRSAVGRPFDRTLVGLGLALFLAGVAVDRMTLKRAGFGESLRRWRTRARLRPG